MNGIRKMDMQKTIDNAVNEFRQKLENELLLNESTKFLCIDTNGEMTILDSKDLQMSYEAFAQMMRSQCTLPKIIHWAAK